MIQALRTYAIVIGGLLVDTDIGEKNDETLERLFE